MESIVQTIERLLIKPENEVLELKEAKDSFDIDDLGRYFSALSNEASLREVDFAWLVFGVADKTREKGVLGHLSFTYTKETSFCTGSKQGKQRH